MLELSVGNAMRTPYVPAVCAIAIFAAVTSSTAEARGRCEPQIGRSSGFTPVIAKLKSFQSILKATGNWPKSQGFISKPVYKCVAFGGLWQCAVRATICKP